ncbi:MAG: LamG-like jellyroll fold domain-containing protein [Acidobacteriota bacterium]
MFERRRHPVLATSLLLLAATLFAGMASAQNSLLGHWDFENSQNLGLDSSTAGRNGAVFGNPQRVAGRDGGLEHALKLDGASYLSIPSFGHNLSGATALTVEAFVRVGAHRQMNVFRSQQPVALHSDRFAVSNYAQGSGWASVDAAAPIETWYHVAGVFQGGTQRIYINGQRIATRLNAFSSLQGATYLDWAIGARIPGASGPDQHFVGDVDDVKVWARVLSDAEIYAASNQRPIGVNDQATTQVDTCVTFDVVANDVDPNGDTLALVTGSPILTPPSHGTATRQSDTLVEYCPNSGWSGTDSFRYRITDGRGMVGSAVAFVTVQNQSLPGCGPGDAVQAIHDVLDGGSAQCRWRGEFKDFNRPWYSFNLPQLAAALMLLEEPQHQTTAGDMWDFWAKYLRWELGDLAPSHPFGYFGGHEITSGNYQHYRISAVLAVHYHARRQGRATVADLAKRWLRAAWGIHALSAGRGAVKTIHDRGQIEDGQLNIRDELYYTGPYLALAGARSSENHWRGVDRAYYFARATGIQPTKTGRESDYQENLRTWLEASWAQHVSSSGSDRLYGLTANANGEAQSLRNLVFQDQYPSALVDNLLGSIRTMEGLNFVGWQKVRATLLEKNPNFNTAPTFGMAYWHDAHHAAGQELHVLYPWTRAVGSSRPYRHDIEAGLGVLRLGVALPYMEADNRPGNSRHPLTTVRIDLPTSTPLFHVRLGRCGRTPCP